MQNGGSTYYDLLVELVLADQINKLTASKEIDEIILDTIIKIIFYSSKIEGNKL